MSNSTQFLPIDLSAPTTDPSVVSVFDLCTSASFINYSLLRTTAMNSNTQPIYSPIALAAEPTSFSKKRLFMESPPRLDEQHTVSIDNASYFPSPSSTTAKPLRAPLTPDSVSRVKPEKENMEGASLLLAAAALLNGPFSRFADEDDDVDSEISSPYSLEGDCEAEDEFDSLSVVDDVSITGSTAVSSDAVEEDEEYRCMTPIISIDFNPRKRLAVASPSCPNTPPNTPGRRSNPVCRFELDQRLRAVVRKQLKLSHEVIA
ncbi:hypothetical protein HDU67_008514 [Dinochytrium kinnereticum]|nr:hypothetical protein HDU67_008514 [Dinochytrium kinnereticum]